MFPDRGGPRRGLWIRNLFAALVACLGLAPVPAAAFPWMIHHGYTSCSQCHVDPSGGGVLTDYGRAQGDILLRTHFQQGEEVDQNPGKIKDFLFGAVPLPEIVHLQGDVRGIVIPQPGNVRAILMQSDLRGAVQTDHFAVSAAIGVVSEGAEEARLSSGADWNLVSREYWVGYSPTKSVTVRAGRMNLPYGIRSENHILDTAGATRTTTNDQQQTGVSMFFNTRKWRAEVMGILGNYQVSPDSFRDRGYSAYLAYAPETTLELGLSSLLTTVGTDLVTRAARLRSAQGLFVRWAPVPPLAILAQGDLLLDNQDGAFSTGVVSTAVLDYEPLQGLHFQAIGEQCDDDFADTDRSAVTGTGAAQWFFAPHADLRLDGGYGSILCTPGAAPNPFASLQAHFYL
jgi:hypothetical protein